MNQSINSPTIKRPKQRVKRWLCECQDPPVLLATYQEPGRVFIKVRDRYWICEGSVTTICPKCGLEHFLGYAS